MIRIYRSLADSNSLKSYVEKKYNLSFDDFSLYRDIGGAVYFAQTITGKFVFKLSIAPYFEKAKKSAEVLRFLQHLKSSVVPIIPTEDGALYVQVDMPEGARIGTLYQFVDGSAATHDDIYDIGKITAHLHRNLSEYKGEIPTVFTKEIFVDKLPSLLQNTSYDKAKTTKLAEYGQILWEKVKDTPLGIVHGDLDMGNILKGKDGSYTIIDCDNVAYLPLAYDVASICSKINYMSVSEKDIDDTKATIKKFRQGYQEVNDRISFGIDEILNFIAVKRFEDHAHALEYVMPFQGNQHFAMFMDATYNWFINWMRIFS